MVTRARHATVASARQLQAATVALAAQCRVMSRIVKATGVPPARKHAADFSGLAQIIVGQQLSAQSAAAIWSRVSAALSPVTPTAILGCGDASLKALGLSGGKIKTLKAAARAVVEGGLDFDVLNAADETQIVAELTAIHGIGPWTADIYMLFALARRDAFAPGDLALQLAVQHHFKLPARPTADEILVIAERWRPSRAVAARLLWADYARARRALLGTQKATAKEKPRKSLK